MNYILFDDYTRNDMLPLTFTRPVADIRIGILTIREKWDRYLKTSTSSLTEKYLSTKYPMVKESNNVLINGSVLPTPELVKAIKELKPDQALVCKDYIIAQNVIEKNLDELDNIDQTIGEENERNEADALHEIEYTLPHIKINYPWDIFAMNRQAIEDDFTLITHGRKSEKLSDSNKLIGKENIFVEAGAKIECATINASNGPVYIGKDAEIMEGCLVRGPFAILDNAILKMGAKIYGPTTIGPHSKVGGEVNNSVIFGYSNKVHEGFLGHSVLGEWCNIGADSNNSNLKNTYDEIKAWNYPQEKFIPTGLQFCGLIMGDYSKCGINTMFNTGTVVGVNANIIGHGFQRNFIPSFSWGNSFVGYTTFDLGKAFDVAERVYKRRELDFNSVDKDILQSIYNLTFLYRKKNNQKK